MNGVEQYIVDNSKEFEVGFVRLQQMSLPGYPQKSIIKILNRYCNTKRIRKGSQEAKDIDEQLNKLKHKDDMDGYRDESYIYVHGDRKLITIYRLKSEKEIPDFYNIIKYKQYQDEHQE